MELERRRTDFKPLLWGLVLIVVGGLFLAHKLTGYPLPDFGQLWPLVFVVIGTGHLLDRRPGSAVTFYLIGASFMAVVFDWFGFTYRTFWPLLVIAVGLGMIVRAFTGEDRRARC